ncbi:SMP-30/gluconolactonase/LRE family protein [Nocardioides sp. R-C-SC26]|uniref:SMP-30/gluconolactonase/LRE family protein n=1 Tax=Nocardioides sp. R-C-SC26 TaxID=2870414 RepID=UPI001E3C6B36|nr:hypothetical protein [Nocardioides sp. R-C-SC26]
MRRLATPVVGGIALALLGLLPVTASPSTAAPAAPTSTTTPASASPSAKAAPRKWDTRVFARVPAPGYPAYVHAHTNGRVYAGSYKAGSARSKVFEWSARGTLLRSWTVPGQRLGSDPGVQVANQTRDGRLVLLETSRRAVMTLDVRSGRFRTIATFPSGAVPNYATWGPDGDLYVTDYHQPIIWRLEHGSRTPERWFRSAALNGTEFGATGIAYRPGRGDLVISQQAVLDGSQLPVNGALYSLPITPSGKPGAIRELWQSRPLDLPDGFGIGRSGNIYVATVGTNQIVELTASGKELGRFPELPLAGQTGAAIPFDTPCSATFLGTTVLVANQSAIFGQAGNQAILQVEVGERGRRPFLPRTATFTR